ncbi:MBG domain-containing protein [Collinsella sp. HCP28S3_E12]|uniref:MBG domain-containing protein n=1 Tax=unclassified Collinsella TaxID=2637548 RepID=UPI003F8BE196
MREKKMGMRRLAACVLAAALALGGAATTLATPTVAEAYPQGAIKPKHLKSELSYGESDVIQLSGGKDYRFAGTVDIDHYEVEGGTKENPTRLYFTDSSSLGGPLTVERDLTYSQHPLFVLKGGYVEFIGDSGVSTEVRCDGKTFLSDSNDYEARGGVDKPNTGKSLNLSVENLKLVSRTENKDTDRAITLYGTMGAGETASFTNVSVSGWKCCKNNAFKVDQGNEIYEASPAPVTIRGSQVAVDATFVNCTFENNSDDCVGALSVVGRSKTPKVTLNGCTFENNSQGMIACDEMKVESGHVHAGNIGVKNAIVALNNCSIRSTNNTSWNGPCSYMFNVWGIQYQMHMTSAIAVAKDASCTINGTVIDDSFVFPSDYFNGRDIRGQDSQRCAVYALGSVTLAGNTKVTTAKAKGVDASDVGSYGKVHVDKSFTGEAVLSIDDTKFDPESNKQYYYYEYVDLGTSGLSQEDLASRLKLANENLAYDVTDGKVKVIHRKHEHEWAYSANRDGYSIAATCNGQYEASHCVYSRDGETISLMSSKSGDLSFTYNGKQRDAVLATTKPSQKDNAVAQGKVKIVSARFYSGVDDDNPQGFAMEGSVPLNAGTYRVVATVAIEGQSDVTLERVFKINPASLAEKDSNRKDLCKVEIIGYDKLKDNVRFSNGDVFNDVPSYEWTGEEIKPRIKVTYKLGDEWIELKEGVDFERFAWDESVSEKDPGAYRSQAWGLGNFTYGKFFYWSIYGTQFENVQAKGFDGTYDGKAHSPSVTVDNAPEGMKIEYSVNGGSLYEDRIPSYTNACAETIKYRITAPDYVPVEGELEIKIAPAEQAAPKDVKTTAATGHALADGSIDGIDNTYEWKAEVASDYQRIAEGETSVKGLAAGKYSVRLKADRNHNASEALTVEVKDGPKKADGSGWKHDDAEHWNICTCGKEDVGRAKHDFEWVVDQAATADKPGSKHERCKTCGYERESVEIPAFGIKGYSDVYDGDYHTVDATSLPEGATAQYSTDGKNWSLEAPKIKDVGTLTVSYEVTIDGVKAEGKVTLEVKPRAITVTAQDASKTYGEADPVFTWAITSGELVEGESLQGIEIKREDDDNVRDGGYALHLTQAKDANPNYNITFVDGVFTINQRVLTVKWGTSEFVYDGKEHCPEATLGNVIGKDDLGATVEGSQTEAGASYTANLTALTGKAAGNYVLPTEGLTCDFSIKNAAQGAPVVQVAAETVSGKRDGKITGVDATMEWRAKGADKYQAVDEGTAELTGLAAGTYEVRYQAKANYDASSATEVTVAAGPKLVVTLPSNQVGYALTSTATELDWHGTATLTMGIDSAYFAGKDYTVKVNGTSVKLSAKGTYELKDVEGDVNVTVEGVLKHEPDGSGWVRDAKNHWHNCRCGDIIDKAEHTFKWVVDKPATTEAKGKKHQECTVCGEKGATEEIAILVPEIIDGKGQTMVVDAVKDLSFRSSAPLAFFQKVLVDDKEVAAENYVLTEGSTIVTLKASFLNTLGVGEHRLSVVSTTGTAETTFTVAEAAKPAPGQTTTTTTTTTSKPKKRASKEALPESGDSTYVVAGAVLAAGVAVLLLAWAIMKRRA